MERHEVLQKACDYLARREHSRKELQRKLIQGCSDAELVEDLLQTLSSEGLQSDERFTESFIHHRYGMGHGPLKIRQELKQRGVDTELFEPLLSHAKFDWYSSCREVRQKRFGIELPGDIKNKAKQSRFLYSRGFDSEMIQYALDKVEE